ncbi:MAG TPA: helix-turn-helix domain-containing protein, partial [Flavitalea sp.]|nr:helix-turn-helix domain-containing protein [Flavitalea sp.]
NVLIISLTCKFVTKPKNAIAEHLWGDEMDMHDNFDFIYTHIKNLRRKLLDAGGKDYLTSIYGLGYKFIG